MTAQHKTMQASTVSEFRNSVERPLKLIAANSPMVVTESDKNDIKIFDANNEMKMAKNPIVIVTEDFLNSYGYAALGWFAKGIPFAFESQRARDLVPSDYGSWVDEPVEGHPKIFDHIQSCSADKIIIVGQPSAPTKLMIEGNSEMKERQVALSDINSNMRKFDFEPLRPEDKNDNAQTIAIDPRSKMDLCRSVSDGSEEPRRNIHSRTRRLYV